MLQFEKLLLLKQIEYSSRKLAQLSHNLSHGMCQTEQTERPLSQGLRAYQGFRVYRVIQAYQVPQALLMLPPHRLPRSKTTSVPG